MAIRLTLWGALLTATVLCSAQVCQAGPIARLDISGTLVKPPCSANFPATQNVEIPKANLNALTTGTTDWTDVAFDFQCTKDSQVQLRFTAGNGVYDAGTLRTTLDRLGLQTRLNDVTGTVRQVKFNLGEPITFAVPDTALNLQFSVRPVTIAQQLPAIGAYSATLMMEVVYL